VDPITLLKQQHREVEALFKEAIDAEDAESRRPLLEQITEKLTLHMSIEEEIFYPAVREAKAKNADELVDEAYEEHHVVKLVMQELPRVDLDDERFSAKMTVMSELVQHHVQEEEKEMFKVARKLGKDELAELGEQMASRAGMGEGAEDDEEEGEEMASSSSSSKRSRRK